MDDKNDSPIGEEQDLREERNDIFGMFERLQNYLEYEAKKVPFNSNLVMADRAHVGAILNMMRDSLPRELQQARHVVRYNKEIMQDAEEIANGIIRDAEAKMAQMVNESEISVRAVRQAETIMREAEEFRDLLHKRTTAYIRNHLTQLEDVLTSVLVEIQRNRKEVE